MKEKLLKITRKFLVLLYPELYKLKNPLFNFESIMSYASNVKRGKNVNFSPTYRLRNVEVGNETYIGENSIVSNTTIGKYCSIGPNFLCGWGIHPTNGLSTAPMFYSTKTQVGFSYSKEDKIEERKEIIIGNDVFVGANVTILDGVTIGDGAVIGAGAVVSKDIPPYAIAVGSPIKVIKYRFNEDQIEALLRIKWWNFPEDQLQDVECMFFDIDDFIKKYDK
ncbi:MAG: CatB-related O-acetyltransferase [Paludibacter sp.]|nr:CatB-related O-acetyltransferase [Paludibacter sp.]